ncbi:MAG: hypothetical protein V1977_05040 [Candidatus Diapherotrites archaeon]
MTFSETVQKILSLNVQSASSVRKEAARALLKEVKQSHSTTARELRKEMVRKAKPLILARPTEPEMRTVVRVLLRATHVSDNIHQAKREAERAVEEYEADRENALKEIAEHSWRCFPENSVVLTHCHSDTVIEVLKHARKKGRVRHVFATETRPLFQGRKTAAELGRAGIPCTSIVDSAAFSVLRDCDVFATGADAILADESVVNKIGTAPISWSAGLFKVPHLVFTSSHKFDPATSIGLREQIEVREPKEVWRQHGRRVHAWNPAFDICPGRWIDSIVSEKGSLTPKQFARQMEKELALDKKDREFVSLVKMLQ